MSPELAALIEAGTSSAGNAPLLPANDILRFSPVSILRRRHLSAMLRLQLLKLRETNMKTILSNQKGNIHHKDMSLHDFSVLACKEKHATP